MNLNRKYYAPAAPGGGGGGDDTLREVNELQSALGQLKNVILKELADGVKELAKDWAQNGVEVGNIVDLTKQLRKEAQDNYTMIEKGRRAEAGVTTELRKATEYKDEIERINKSIAYQQDLISRLSDKELELTKEERDTIFKTTELLKQQVELYKQKLKLAEKNEEKLEKEKKITQSIANGYGKAIASLERGINRIPIVGSLLGPLMNSSKVMEAMNEKAKKLGKKADTIGGRWKILGAGIAQTFMNMTNPMAIGSALVGGLFTLLYKVFMMAINLNKKFFETAKILGTSVGEATRLYGKFQAMAPLGMRAKEVAEAFAAASDNLGFMASTGADFAITMAGLQKNVGASAEHMGALATQSALSGKSITGTFISMVGSAKAAGAQNKLMLSTRQILDKIAKVSSTVLINFKGNVNALATAVVRATKLGTTLEQINKQAESLLDFETSIASEFEAEALTGRNINLERARSLALAGKTSELMEELNAQGMSLSEFENMNVIQREAFAKAIGLSNEEFSKQLIMQKQAEALGAKEGESLQKRYEILRKQGMTHDQIVAKIGAQEAASLRQQSLADQWAAMLERIQDILGRIVMGPVTEIVNKVIAFLNNTKAIEAVGQKLKSVFQGISNILSDLPSILKSAITVAKVLAGLAIVRALASMISAGSAMGGVPGAIIGGVAAVATGAYLYGKLNEAMSGMTSSAGAPPSIPTPSNIEPPSPSAYSSGTPPQGGAAGAGTARLQTNVTLQVDGREMAKTTQYHTVKDPYSTFDGSTSKAVETYS